MKGGERKYRDEGMDEQRTYNKSKMERGRVQGRAHAREAEGQVKGSERQDKTGKWRAGSHARGGDHRGQRAQGLGRE